MHGKTVNEGKRKAQGKSHDAKENHLRIRHVMEWMLPWSFFSLPMIVKMITSHPISVTKVDVWYSLSYNLSHFFVPRSVLFLPYVPNAVSLLPLFSLPSLLFPFSLSLLMSLCSLLFSLISSSPSLSLPYPLPSFFSLSFPLLTVSPLLSSLKHFIIMPIVRVFTYTIW